VPVFIKRGCSADLLINIALDILGWIPGVIREPLSIVVSLIRTDKKKTDAWYIISKNEVQRAY
jgi:hypothetical protein